jgi:hypothetical protein
MGCVLRSAHPARRKQIGVGEESATPRTPFMSIAATSQAAPATPSSCISEVVPQTYQFSVKDQQGKWLDWYPLAVETDAEAEASMVFWRGRWRHAPVSAPTPERPPAAVVAQARAEALLATVPPWIDRLEMPPTELEFCEKSFDEQQAMLSENKDLRTLIHKLVAQVDVDPGDPTLAQEWISSLQRAATRCRAAGDLMDSHVLDDITFLFRVFGAPRRSELRVAHPAGAQ